MARVRGQDVDSRLGPPRRVTQGSDYKPYSDRAAWEKRVRHLREQALVAAGLWPLPVKCDLNPRVTSTVDCGDYTIANLYFTSCPGFYVTASLYRPRGNGPFPAVLCAHGHAKHGRLAPVQPKSADPASYQARAAGLARLGCIALLYDMVGYAESQQVRHPTDSPKVRVREGTDDFEGLEFEMHCLSTLGLQTWNSMRAVDYLLSRPDVDPQRIAITGGSGGATQTLMLMMTDERLAAAAPVCMVSTGFQGDCTCEQAALSKIGTDTVEFSAAFAPKPLIVVGATGDWTKEIVEKGGPEIRATYGLMGAAERVSVVRYEAPHNYNRRSREAVYSWLNRWFKLGHAEPIAEAAFEPLAPEKLAVFGSQHPRPSDALDAGGLKRYLIASAQRRLESLRPVDATASKEFQRVVGTALKHMVATSLPEPTQVFTLGQSRTKQGAMYAVHRIPRGRPGEAGVGVMEFQPREPDGAMLVLVHAKGASALLDDTGQPGPFLRKLLARGCTVLAPDVTLQEGSRDPRTAFFACFNRTLLAERVRDVLTTVGYARGHAKKVHLVGIGDAGVWCLLARGLCGDAVARTAVEIGSRRFRDVASVDDPLYLPGALRYGDLPVLAALAAPGELHLSGARGFDTSWLRQAYRDGGLHLEDGPASADALAAWLTRPFPR